MFTGIVENMGKVLSMDTLEDTCLLRLSLEFGDEDGLEQGASIAVNGCCLTLRENAKDEASFDLLEETLSRTNLGDLQKGSLVNLERSLPANGRLGGHFVTGHIDTKGIVQIFEKRGKNLYLQIRVDSNDVRYLVDKGSVALDGCSLTVCDVTEDSFAVWLIPHTLTKTCLAERKVGDSVNLEFDLLAKYMEKLAGPILSRDS